MFAASDLVCFGYVKSVSFDFNELTGSRSTRFVVEVRDFYKGSRTATPPTVFLKEAHVSDRSPGSTVFQEGHGFLLFLKLIIPGTYGLTDRFIGATEFETMPIPVSSAGIDRLENALREKALTAKEIEALKALELLEGIKNLKKETLESAIALTRSGSSEIAVRSLAVLLTSQAPENLWVLVAYLERYRGDDSSWAFIDINGEIGQFKDIRALPALKELSRARLLAVRRGAVYAARMMHRPEAGPLLAESLDAEDKEIAYQSVIGLCELANCGGDYGPDMGLFAKRPGYYVQLWKARWEETGISERATEDLK